MRFAIVIASLVATLAVPAAARAGDPILPLAAIQPGSGCKALSVVRGTVPVEFDAEILDVLRGDPVAAGPRLLVKVSGAALAGNGVGPGFSGSPLICTGGDGVARNAGAISETVGAFGNELVLATPIEQILGERPEVPATARSAPALLRSARPLAGPITISGLGPAMRTAVSRASRGAGRLAIAVPSGPLAAIGPVPLVPGAAMSAGTSTGDIAVGSIGTVSYRDGDALWAFGHPLDGVGRRALLLQDAYVYTVVGNPLATEESITYKLAVPLRTRGVIGNDAVAAIAGRVGPAPRTIPLTVRARNLDTGRALELRSDVVDERDLDLGSGLELTTALSLGQAATEVLRSSPPRVSGEMCVRVRLRERNRRLGFCGDYFDGEGPFEDMAAAFALIDGFKLGRITPVAAEASIALRRGVNELFIVRARAPRRVRPGRRIRIRMLLRRRRGGLERMSFRYRVPRSTRPGVRVLTLRGVVPRSLEDAAEESLELLFGGGFDGFTDPDDPGSPSVRALAASIRALGRPQGLRATFAARGKGPIVRRLRRSLIRGKVEIPIRVIGKRRRSR